MRTWNRCAIGLFMLAGAAHGQVLTPPTPDEPVLFIQVYQPPGVADWPLAELCQWWPCSGPFNRNMIPMLKLDPNSVPDSTNPEAYADKLHRYYTTFVHGQAGSGHLTPTQQAEYESRLAVEFFNFGGDEAKTNDPTPNHALEFWHLNSGDDLADDDLIGARRYVNPWMTTRLGEIQSFMAGLLSEWTSGASAIPAPRGGVYFDNELLLFGDSTANTFWASVLEDEARWNSTYLPGSTATLAALWNDARVKYGWPDNPSNMLVLADQLNALDHPAWTGHGNRDFKFWLTDIAERALTGATNVAACNPLWSHDWDPDPEQEEYLDFPIANYGDYFIEQRRTTNQERFGWHEWRPNPAAPQDVEASRDGWFGQIINVRDDYGGIYAYGEKYYCQGCLKHPYLMASEVPGYEHVIIGAHARENGLHATGSHHAPVLYTLYTNLSAPTTSLTHVNPYVPDNGHPQRVETADDATIREARFTLDSIGFSGVSSDSIIPWILPPDDQGGVDVQGLLQPSTRDLFRRMLMLMRSKEISRIQVFNMKMFPTFFRACAESIYDEVYACDLADLQTIKGQPLTPPDLDRLRNTVHDGLGAPKSYSVESVVGTDYGKSATATRVDFQFDQQFTFSAAIGLRLVFECEVTGNPGPGPGSTSASVAQFYCEKNLRGMVYLWNWGTFATAPGWVQLDLSDPGSPGEYRFPACFAGAPFDLSMRREVTIVAGPSDPGYEFISSGGKCMVLLVHASDSGDSFVSHWDLVQMAKFTSTTYCEVPNPLVQPEGTVPGATSYSTTTTGADINFDGSVTAADLGDFSSAFSEAAPLADYNGDELITSDDALTFLEDFVEQID